MPVTQGTLTASASISPQSLSYAHSDVTPPSRGRGRPHKEPEKPSYDDIPVNASTAELLKWQRKKNAVEWRYTKLTSEDADAYRGKENKRVKCSASQNRQDIIDAAAGKDSTYHHIPKSSQKTS